MKNNTPGPSLRTAILTIGDEITTGHLVDTNAGWLSAELTNHGCVVTSHISLPDDQRAIADVLHELTEREVSVILATGGLGPTKDDLTRYALAEVLGEELVVDEDALQLLRRRYETRGRTLSESNTVQVMRPPSASFIPNSQGTAPGIFARLGEMTRAYFMPGIPGEMTEMWDRDVRPDLQDAFDSFRTGHHAVRLVHCTSYPESRIGEALSDLMERGANPVVATLPADSVVLIRIRATGASEGEADQLADATAAEVECRLTPYVFAHGGTSLAEAVHAQLRATSETLSVAESCTGGLLGELLTIPAGSSDVFVGGWMTYSNDMKSLCLGVDPAMIEKHGAVSGLVADQMATGALEKSGADYALAITGIAGPDGGTERKPVGTVYIALAELDEDDAPTTIVKRFQFPGKRDDVRKRSATAALAMLHFFIKLDGELPDLLWENRGPDTL